MRRGHAESLNQHFGLSTKAFLQGKKVSFFSFSTATPAKIAFLRGQLGVPITANDFDADVFILDLGLEKKIFSAFEDKVFIRLEDLDSVP